MKLPDVRTIDSTTKIRENVVITDNGRTLIRQCSGKTTTERAVSQHIVAHNNKTHGDILQRLRYNQQLRSIVRGE